MKKLAIILAVLMLLSALPMTALAGPPPYYELIPNDDVIMPKSAPTIDGKISYNEGWSKRAKLDFDTVGFFWQFLPMTMNADLYFAYSEDGIYFAADVTEFSFLVAGNEVLANQNYEGNSFIVSTDNGLAIEGRDGDDSSPSVDIPKGETRYGYNGDILTLSLDPDAVCLGAKLTYCPWYNIGIFENSGKASGYEAKVYRSMGNFGDITDRVETAVTVKEHREYDALTVEGIPAEEVYGEKPYNSGYVVEMFLPWDILVEDIDTISYGMAAVTKEDLAAKGAEISAAVSYMDRFFDEEQGDVDNWGRWIVVCEMTESGVAGAGSSGVVCEANGLKLINGDEYVFENEFTDVAEGKWFYEAALYCNARGVMNGTGVGQFSPTKPLTREQFATILANLAHIDTDEYKNAPTKFTDVPTGKWYSGPIAWAVEAGLTSGLTETTFGRGKTVTRQQLAQFMYEYAKANGCDMTKAADLTVFPDYDRVQNWAKESMSWAVACGLISGKKSGDATILDPRGTANRGQVAVILRNFMEDVDVPYRIPSSYLLSPASN